MATLKNVFTGGKMNLDVDERLLKKGEYRTASNIRIANSEGSDVGAIEKSLSNRQLTNLDLGDNIVTVGGTSDEFEEKLYWLVKSNSGSYIIEYDILQNKTSFVLKDTRIGSANVLALNENYLVTGIVLVVDTDNDNRFLIYTDNNTQPKCINIERAKTYGENGFYEEMILLIKKPPLDAPKINLVETSTQEENNIQEKFIVFGYRYKYLDGEYSAISPYSNVAFKAKNFQYDFSTGTNEGMINRFNKVEVFVNTGSELVTDIELVFKENNSNNLYSVEQYSKSEKRWEDNEVKTILFSNNQLFKRLPSKELFRSFDNVPLKAKALELIGNRLILGNYTENYDLLDNDNKEINIDLSVESVSEPIKSGTATESLKSNRDYEIGIVYLDEFGRQTTVLTSEKNNVHIPLTDAINKNHLAVKLNNKAPKFAKAYRFYVKQNKYNYDIVVPTLFYEDGLYVWVKIERSDVDKIKEGDFLIVKSDTRGLKQNLVQTKVLEIKYQDRNFLELNDTNELKQLAGTYVKIRPLGFNLDIEDIEVYSFRSYDTSDGRNYPIANNITLIQDPVFYGVSENNDLTVSGTYTADTDKRFKVTIDSVGDGVSTFNTISATEEISGALLFQNEPITAGTAKLLSDGVSITFDSNTGHAVNDYWTIGAKSKNSGIGHDARGYAYGIFRGIDGDLIRGGARISFIYDAYNENPTQKVELNFIASKEYENLEEWYYEDNINEEFAKNNLTAERIWFRKGNVINRTGLSFIGGTSGETYLDITNDGSGTMNMVIRTLGYENSGFDKSPKVKSTIEIRQSDKFIIFETKSDDINSDIYYEIGKTYPIKNGLHQSYDINDTFQTNTSPAILKLPLFNCYSWGNGFESIKIKDLFNAKAINIDTRPSTGVKNYQENIRISSLTYSNVYEQTLNYNGLNEFNMSELNFKDLDDKYGSIQKIMAYNTDLDVWQEDKVHRVLYGKSTLYNEDGSSNVGKSNLILGTVVPYVGEFGISENPESLVSYGNYRYWVDTKRGVVLRKGQSGIEIISKNGMRDWFRDYFRNNPNAKNICAYDPYYDQVTLGLNKEHTLTFDEQVLGFTSFHSFIPDWMLRLNNRFYSIKDGQLYLHNEEGNGYNNFYGVQYGSKITTIFNDKHSHDKIFKTLVLEGTNPWRANLKTNYTESHIKSSEFNQRESRWFAHTRKNENPNDLHGISQGIGVIKEVSGLDITVLEIPQNVSIGDSVWQVLDDDSMQEVGTIKGYTDTVITLENSNIPPQENAFVFSKKDPRTEGGEMRGYYLEVTLTDDTNEKNELFAITSEVVKSHL